MRDKGLLGPVNQSATQQHRERAQSSSSSSSNEQTGIWGAAAALSGWNWKHRKSGWGLGELLETTKSLSEQGLANHGTAAAGNDGDWLAGGPLSAQYSPKNVCSVRIVITVP